MLNHRADGRKLRVFVADGKLAGSDEKVQRYVGEFALDEHLPYLRTEAPDVEGVLRSVIVFRLRPVGESYRRDEDSSKYPDATKDPAIARESLSTGSLDLVVNSVALEVVNAVEFAVSAKAAGVSWRREAELVSRFEKHLVGMGHNVGR